MKRRLVVLTEIIAPYRIPVFNALARHESIDLHVIFLSETDPSLRQWRVYKDEIQFSHQVLPAWRRRAGKYSLLLNWGLGKALSQASPDAIICGGYNYLASWQAARWAKHHRVPFLLWVESTAYDDRRGHKLVEYLKRRFVSKCDAFVAAGRSQSEYLQSLRVPREIIFTAPDAVDNDFFAQAAQAVRKEPQVYRQALKLPERFFLYVGRLVRAKGVFDLLEAYATLAPDLRSEVGLVLVGNGTARTALAERGREIHPGSVHFAGFAQREDLAAFYALADVLLFPTHSDPWGLVVNEAMACGLPIISTTVAGCTADLVEDRWNGRVVNPHNVGELASAMDLLARNSDLRSRMAINSRERILQYSPQACAEGLAGAAIAVGQRTRHG